MVPTRYDATAVVAARRATRPPTSLFVAGLVVGWALDIVLVVFVVQIGVGTLVAVLAGVVGYLLLPVPVVTVLRDGWLRTHRDRAVELDRQLADQVPAFRAWVDARVGEPVGLPPALATVWLLRSEPSGPGDLLALPAGADRRVGGPALAARHDTHGGRVLVRLAVLPTTTGVADGHEPPDPI